MKNMMKVITCLVVLLLLTGCVLEGRKNDIINYLKDKKVIDKKWELVYEITSKNNSTMEGIPISSTNYYDYVYKDGNDYYIIRIDDNNKKYDKEENSNTYVVTKYKATNAEEFKPSKTTGLSYTYKKDGKQEVYGNHIYENSMEQVAKYEVKFTKKEFLIFIWDKKELKKID